MLNTNEIAAYNSRLQAALDKKKQAEIKIAALRENVEKELAEVSKIVGFEVTADNIEQVYTAMEQQIAENIQKGNALLDSIDTSSGSARAAGAFGNANATFNGGAGFGGGTPNNGGTPNAFGTNNSNTGFAGGTPNNLGGGNTGAFGTNNGGAPNIQFSGVNNGGVQFGNTPTQNGLSQEAPLMSLQGLQNIQGATILTEQPFTSPLEAGAGNVEVPQIFLGGIQSV